MTEIVRGDGMKYALAYNEFHNLESIGIEGKAEKLIQYTYKNGNGRLKEMKYANGDTMKATYNAIEQMVAEKWFDSTENLTAHYKYVYDGDGNIVRSIDILANREYNYEYEEGRIVRATEAEIELSGDIVTSKVIVNTVKYYYDTEGKMTKKVLTFSDNSTHTVHYENSDDNTVVKFSAGGRTVTSHSKTDSFGRKIFDELQLGTDFVSRQFVYHAGKVTAEHKDNAKVKSSATTQLVSQIILSNGITLSYGYDDEERITSVSEKYIKDGIETTHTVNYTYDALGQLLTETSIVQTIDRSREEPIVETSTELVNSMEYDNYGNITKKNDTDYICGKYYPDDDFTQEPILLPWKDLLTYHNGVRIDYDEQGNPTSYLGSTLTWEKGRQLKSYDNNTYTYNANGIRTSKTIRENENDEGVTHYYTLDGTKILRETWDGNTLIPLYDNEDNVCGIIYNGVPYYFLKNLQGDVIAIVDKDAKTVARYSYDAWGVVTSAVTDTKLTNGVDIATINPFRYRSYYFDEEIGLYYLQSRYYNAGVGRFVNADDVEVTTHSNKQQNSFTYCANNGIVAYDTLGYFPVHLVVGTVAGFIWGIAPRLLKMILFKQRAKLSDVLCDGLSGAVGGFITAATGNSTLGTFVGTLIGEIVRYFVQERPFSSGTSFLTILVNISICLIMACIAALASFIAGKLVNKITKKKLSNKQIKQYLKQTKKLKSALGIGTNGKTARRMWYMDCGITTALANGLNTVVEFIKEFLKKVMS